MATLSLDDALDELASVPPRAFTKERNALAARLTKLGQTADAAKIKARRAPAVPVWAVNRLASENPKLIDALISAAERVGAAQLGRDTTMPLGAAMTAYREATDALLARLDDLLAAADVKASHQVRLRIQNTLMAAAADPKTRKALRGARLEHELTASGFDLFSGAVPTRRETPVREGREPKRRGATAEATAGPLQQPRQITARDRRAAARDARARLAMEAKAAADRERVAAAERLRPLREAAEKAAAMLAQAQQDARRAAAAVREATRHKRAADQALRAAGRRRG